MIENWVNFGDPPGRALERFLVDFGVQNGRVWEAKSGPKKGSVARRAFCQKTKENQWFFQYLEGLRGSDFHWKLVQNLDKFWIDFGPA